jgi:hypothetical protein
MIRAFREHFLPKVKKVYSTEEKVELSSGQDSNIGFADAVVDFEGYDRPIIFDFKTAGKAYAHNSVRESVQLSQYLYVLSDKYNTDLAGYAVFLKNIVKNRTKICKSCEFDGSGGRHKTCNNQILVATDFTLNGPPQEQYFDRCGGEWAETINPECKVQIIIDTIPLEFQEQTVDEIGLINDKINSGVVEKNLEACHNNYGKPCEFINLCHKGSMDGLIILPKKDIDKSKTT